MTTYSTDTYFAASDATKTVSDLSRRVDNWYLRAESSGYFEKIRRSYAAYHGMYWSTSGHALSFMGDTQELVQIGINHYRNIAQHILVNITSTRPAFSSRSINSDFQSQAQANLADSLLDYYMREKRLEKYLYTAVEYAIALSAGFIMMEWSPTSGQQVDFDEELGIPIYEGDLVFSNCSPLDVITDTSKETWDDNDWIMVRSFKNRFSLMAKYPDQADKIKSVKSKAQTTVTLSTNAIGMEETDDIPLYTFMHKRCDALPQGRYLQFAGDDIILNDTPLPYKDIPIFRVAASDILGTPFGYSPMFDLLPIQDAVNSMYSASVTNNAAFGVQNIFVPRGADLGIESLSGGLNIIEANAEPKPLNLTQSAPELYTLIKMLEQNMETLSGVNSVARGNPQDSLRSGTSLALVQSQAVQFMSGLQQQYVRLVEDVGTGLINILKEYAKTNRVAQIVGKSNKAYIKEFTGQDLKSINRIVVDFSNPMSKCLEKGTEVLMANGSIKKVEEIQIGELVMGPDSKPRTVKNVNSGQETMYKIFNKDGDFMYGCNESHVLTLKYCSKNSSKKLNLKQYEEVDISVGSFLKFPKYMQNLFMGFTTGVEFEEKTLPFDPYLLGIWLGDGNSNCLTITTADKIIEEMWLNYATELGYNSAVYHQSETIKQPGFRKTEGKTHKSILDNLNLYNNKHIPEIYKINSKENRLQLLAGLLDSDGCLSGNTFVINQKNTQLANDIKFLALSLGFKARIQQRKAKAQTGVEGTYNTIYISGDTHEIPTLLARKQARPIKKHRNALNYGLNIKNVGEGTYYGFTLAEEPHFVLGNFSVTHNTVAGKVQMAEQMLQYGIIKDPRDFLSVINTGQLHSVTDSYNSELLLIKSENEAMLEGKTVSVIAIDEHLKHINEHKALINDPIARSNPQLVQLVLSHIQQHIQALQTVDPQLLIVTGQTPMTPPPPPPMPGQAPPMPQGAPAPMPPQGQPGPAPQGMPQQAPQGPRPMPPQGGGAPVAPQGSQPKRPPIKIDGIINNPSASAINLAQPRNTNEVKLPKGFENAPQNPLENMIKNGLTS